MGRIRRRRREWGSWEDVVPRAYASGAERHTLVGPEDGAAQVELRYFRIPVGGASALERHPHEHAIMVVHGAADVRIGDEVHPVGVGDAVFIASDELHELRQVGDEPLGFICTAPADRGRPGRATG